MLYRYLAIDPEGGRANGTEEAGSPADARALLRDRGMIAYEIEIASPSTPGKEKSAGVSWLNLSGRRLDLLTQTTRHWALLLKAGVPMADRKSTRLNSSHLNLSRMPSSA